MTSKRTRERLIHRLMTQGIDNFAVLDVLMNTPRHLFLDEALAHRAYEDTALPIGHGQTLSQPYIVARMTELLLETVPAPQRVLEVGTGSGYQTAVLAQLVNEVYTVERIKPLQGRARNLLGRLGLKNIQYRLADGGFGWPQAEEFAAILSTAAPCEIPRGLLKQLAPGGVLVIPVGSTEQYLQRVTRQGESREYNYETLDPVRFVPLLSGISQSGTSH